MEDYKIKQRSYIKGLDKCPICLNPMGKKSTVKTKCNHTYHFKCIWRWVLNHNTCCLCRKQIVEADIIFFLLTVERNNKRNNKRLVFLLLFLLLTSFFYILINKY